MNRRTHSIPCLVQVQSISQEPVQFLLHLPCRLPNLCPYIYERDALLRGDLACGLRIRLRDLKLPIPLARWIFRSLPRRPLVRIHRRRSQDNNPRIRRVTRGLRRGYVPDQFGQVCFVPVERDVLVPHRERGIVRAEPNHQQPHFLDVLLIMLSGK